MRKILFLDNVDPADSDYPYGRIRDISAAGASDGTPVYEKLLGDQSQFWMKLMDEAGVTPNDLPDNEYNGYQLFEALELLVPDLAYRGNTVYTDGNNLPVTNISSTYWVANFPTTNVEIGIVSNAFGDTIDSLGSDMPINTTVRIAVTNGVNPVNFVANSTNAGSEPVIRVPGVTGNNTIFNVQQNGLMQFTRMNHGWVAVGKEL